MPVTERNYLYEDSLIWARIDSISGKIWREVDKNPAKEDSLTNLYNKAFQNALKENISTAVRYAAVPSGIKRVYMVRGDIPKDSLSVVLSSLPDSIRNSFYGELVNRHISTHQLSDGDNLVTFRCRMSDGSEFDWNTIDGKNVLVVYSGYYCMGNYGRRMLKELYEATSRDSFEIIHYWIESDNLESLQNEAQASGFKFAIVSDSLKDASPIKIIYGCQATPTCYFFDSSHQLLYKGVFDEFPWEMMRKHLGI